MSWELFFTKQAQKDAKKLASSNLRAQTERLLGDLDGAYSRRINIQHRLVYQVYIEKKAVKVLRMWTHYE